MVNVEVSMKKGKIKNPLIKRVPREIIGDWKKYLVVFFFLVLTIGFVSGMYVANESMLTSAREGISKYHLEDGHFELKDKADSQLIEAVESGSKGDIKKYYYDKAKKEFDTKFKKEFDVKYKKEFDAKFKKEFDSRLAGQALSDEMYDSMYKEAYNKAWKQALTERDKVYSEAYDKGWKKVSKEIDKKYKKAEKKYKLNDSKFKNIPVKLYENFYRNEDEDYNNDDKKDGTVRVFAKTKGINEACLLDGKFPENDSEIAVDRMHADNVGIKVGDTIKVSGREFKVTGLIAYVNYATLHEKATDLMFDALKFNVAMVTDGAFDSLTKDIHYSYAWKYDKKPADEIEEKKLSDDFTKVVLSQSVVADNELKDYLPKYSNPAINFATDDMGSDLAMGSVILNILIVIIAFIFAVTISNTITKESSTIGTLRASGYTKGELVRHYISSPVIVTLLAACVGNILGYTVFKKVVVGMYYNSYSLPTYKTIWNADAFIKTTVVPVVLMFIVNLIVISKMIQHTPLQFLRHDLKKTKRKKAIRLPKWKFINRFRLRIMFQNAANYIILFIGILFITVMLAFAVGMPDTLKYYQDNAAGLMISKYQYVLKSYEKDNGSLVDTDNKDAEKFSMTSLQKKGDSLDEEVSVYGVEKESRYIKIDDLTNLKEGEVYISKPFSEKYNINIGDTLSLDEKYEDMKHKFKIKGIYDRCQSIAVFMSMDNYRKIFDNKKDEFSGFLSDTKISDIDKNNIATVITKRDITKMCDQLDHSMGSYMTYFQVLCILLSAVLIYLLTKIIIEKNENAISMTKILGYENSEIAGLYLVSTSIVVVVADIISVILGTYIISYAWKAILAEYSGWFAFHMEPVGYVKMFLFVLIGYLVVMFFDFNRIKKIPMDQALKNVE